ncbi:MAG: hypothetical protein WD151_10620 [Phycisphaeraceae bacterium]
MTRATDMEEHRTRRALDELADLFLTGPAGGAPRPATEPTDAPQSADEGDDVAPATPTAADADHANDAPRHDPPTDGNASTTDLDPLNGFDLDGPAPIRLPPKTGPSRRPYPPDDEADDATPPGDVPHTWHAPPNAVAGGSLAAGSASAHLRLHRTEEAETDEASDATGGASRTIDRQPPLTEPATASVEAVLLGNLPGLNGPWLTQYAQRLAQGDGPVLLLHLDEQGVDVELVEPTDRPQTPGRVPPRGQAGDLVDRLETLVRLAPNPVRRVLVHVEANAQPTLLARLRCLDVWTLISGADDAATVAAYRMVKRMIETDPAATPRRIGVMMMGCDDETARRGIARLRSAAGSFLDAPLELVGAQRQMAPVNVRQLGRFEPVDKLWPPLRRWLASLEPAEATAIPATRPQSVAASVDEAEDVDEAVEPSPADEAVVDTPREPEPDKRESKRETRTGRAAEHRGLPAGAREDVENARPCVEPATSAKPADDDAPDLAAFLTRDSLAGGVTLEARCPHQPNTQLLLDQNGRLHLLHRHAPADDATPADDDLPQLRRAILELLEARTWVRDHLDLLQLTQRQYRFDAAADPQLHLFTHRADLATALVARLGSTLKLHLLQKVGQGDHATWFSTPLS